MLSIDCTLLSDGSFDASLLPILKWVIRQHAGSVHAQCEWADLLRVPKPPRVLIDRIRMAIDLYRCDVLFIHRDAEKQPPELRYDEINTAMETLRGEGIGLPHVCVVPIRMTEAWLLLDETAIRKAAGNPNGVTPLEIPRPDCVEALPDPKSVLLGILKTASGLRKRRLKRFHPHRAARLVPDFMGDFACLRTLTAFRRLEADVQRVAAGLTRA